MKKVFTLIMLLVPYICSAGTINLAWDKPSRNTNGEILIDIAGYKVYCGTQTSTYDTIIDVGNVLNYQLINIKPGSYFCVVTVYNRLGYESDFSNEVQREVANITLLSIKADIFILADDERLLKNKWEDIRTKIRTLELAEVNTVRKGELKTLRFQTSAIQKTISNIISYRNVLTRLINNLNNRKN